MENAIGVLIILALFLLLAFLAHRAFDRGRAQVRPAGNGQVVEEPPERPVGVRERVLHDVQFIRYVLEQVTVDPERRVGLESQLKRLEARTRRRALQLAIIGEFNSGKSTFINALLRRRLLKSANIATTASATEIRHGSRLFLGVRLTDGTGLMGTEEDCAALAAKFERFLGPQRGPVTLPQLIELVTSHPEASRLVERTVIEVPAEWLDRGICILDTPGVGAGPEYAAHHQAVTERVLADQADAAVVLIPADSNISRTLLDFLDSVVRPFLARCIFVITKLDGVDPEERPAIRSHVNTILTKFMGTAPTILEAGALTVLLPADPGPENETVRAHWRAEFARLEAFLLDAMSRQGPAIVAETLIRLVHLAIGDLDAGMAERREQVQQAQRTLEANSVMKLEQVLAGLRARCQEAMSRTLARVEREMTDATQKFEAHSKQRVRDLLDDAGWGNLKEIITDRIPGAIGDEERAFNQSLGESFALLDAQCVEAHHVFTAQFESRYRNLKSLGMAQLHQSVAAIPRTRPLLVDCMYGTPFSAGPRLRDFIGIAWNKDKKREEIRGVLFAAIATHVSRAASHWRGRLTTAGSAISAELDRVMQVHLRQYQEAVNAMIREHERRRAALESEQSAMQSYAAQLRERAGELNRFQQSLAAGAAAGQV